MSRSVRRQYLPLLLIACYFCACRSRDDVQDNRLPHLTDSATVMSVKPDTSYREFILCTDNSVASVALQLARRYRWDSIAFLKPIDTSKDYLGGRISCRSADGVKLVDAITRHTMLSLSVSGKTLFVGLDSLKN